jgi:hypothetical protein
MTTTAGIMIDDALLALGVLAEGDTPTADMSAGALRVMNRMLDSMSVNQSFAYYASLVTRALTGESSFTIGPTGNVAGSRPIGIESAYVDRGGIHYPVRVIDNQIFDGIVYPGSTGSNTAMVYYEATVPDGIVHVWPLATGCTLGLRTINQVVNFADLTTPTTLPPGYEECIVNNLAVRLSPFYPAIQLNPVIARLAKTSLDVIQRRNNVIPTMSLPRAVTQNGSGYSLSNFMGGY